MKVFVGLLWGFAVVATTTAAEPPQPHLYSPSFEIDGTLVGKPAPYQPQPGDIFLATDSLLFNIVGHWLAGSGAPHHSGIVAALPDGGMGVLESGPHNTFHVRIMTDVVGHFCRHEERGERVWIRQRATPLTKEQ